MDSHEDLELASCSENMSSPVPDKRLKRLKKVKTVEEIPSQTGTPDFDVSGSGFEGSDKENEVSSGSVESPVEGSGSGLFAKRALDFDSETEEIEGNSEEEEIRVPEREELVNKRHSFDELENKERKKKKKKRAKNVDDEEILMLPERKTAKERREQLAQLRAESQRLLRESSDSAFKPAPLVQKPISSVLEKIRRRRLEVSKKRCLLVDGHDGFSSEDVVALGFENAANEGSDSNKAMQVENKRGIANDGITFSDDKTKKAVNISSQEKLYPELAVDGKTGQAFRAPIEDTQALFSYSQTSQSKDGFSEETPDSPLEEVMAPSLLALNLKLDSASPEVISSDEENNDKENIDPQPHESVDLSPAPNGDPVKAFVDEEAEEEDDSDNDLLRFQDDGDDDGDVNSEDIEELNDMIESGYEEKQSDIERRMELHQRLIDQQDAAKTENLLSRWGPKHRETSVEEVGMEEDETDEEDDDFDDDATEDKSPINLRMHIKKIKEMMPLMFSDKDDMYISSDEEEVEKKLVEQCLSEKANQKAELLPPGEDARSRELFGYIKKVNNIPDTRRKAKPSSFSNMLFMGEKRSMSSKSSFIGRGSNCSRPSSRNNGSGILRSFIFEREDSNSRSTISVEEDACDVIQREHRPTKTATAKFSNSQTKSSSQSTKDKMETSSGAQLLEILRRSSLQRTECTHSIVGQTESIFSAFKLEKKSVGTKANVTLKSL